MIAPPPGGGPRPPAGDLVSVVIPVHDNVAHLEAAIDSVLAQSHDAVEVVAVDDGSTDGSATVLADYGDRIRSVRQPNRGVAAARNRGVRLAAGAYLAFLDADDRFPPDRCARAVDTLRRRDDVDAVVGVMDEFLSGAATGDPAGVGMRSPRRGVVARLPGTLTIRRSAFGRVGPFDEGLTGSESIDWFARAEAIGLRLEHLGSVMLERRLHGDNASLADPRRLGAEYLEVVVRRVRARRPEVP